MDKSVTEIGIIGISNGAGATFISRYLDYYLNKKDKPKVFVSRPDRFRIIDGPSEGDMPDIIVAVIDPLPSLLVEGAAKIIELMDSRAEVIWLLNRDNQGVNRRTLKKYLGFLPELSQQEIPRETICRAEYNCIELPEVTRLEGVEKLADDLRKMISLNI